MQDSTMYIEMIVVVENIHGTPPLRWASDRR